MLSFPERPSRYFGGCIESNADAVCGPKRLEGEGSGTEIMV